MYISYINIVLEFADSAANSSSINMCIWLTNCFTMLTNISAPLTKCLYRLTTFSVLTLLLLHVALTIFIRWLTICIYMLTTNTFLLWWFRLLLQVHLMPQLHLIQW